MARAEPPHGRRMARALEPPVELPWGAGCPTRARHGAAIAAADEAAGAEERVEHEIAGRSRG